MKIRRVMGNIVCWLGIIVLCTFLFGYVFFGFSAFPAMMSALDPQAQPLFIAVITYVTLSSSLLTGLLIKGLFDSASKIEQGVGTSISKALDFSDTSEKKPVDIV